jgi:hypothetical protein
MQKQTPDDKEISVTNAYSLFVYAIRTQITRDYYLRRLRTFFDYIKVLLETPNPKNLHLSNIILVNIIK